MTDERQRIWKFVVTDALGVAGVIMPQVAKLLHVAMQNGKLCVWALVWPQLPKVTRRLVIYGTGDAIERGERAYVGTVMDGQFVWHVFDYGETSD